MGADYTIEEYLRGLFDFDIPDSTLKSILYRRKIQWEYPMILLEDAEGTRKKELAEADLCVWLASSSSSSSGEYESDGSWQHRKANKNVADRKGLIERADSIYRHYGETSPISVKKRMTISNA